MRKVSGSNAQARLAWILPSLPQGGYIKTFPDFSGLSGCNKTRGGMVLRGSHTPMGHSPCPLATCMLFSQEIM